MTGRAETLLAQYTGQFGRSRWTLRALSTPEDMAAAEDLQRAVWPGSEADLMPAHFLLTAAHNGGLVLGAFVEGRMAAYALGFTGFDDRWSPARLKHCSHQLGVHPDFRNWGIGFDMKRAQWFVVRGQGIDLITWTYDPLLGRNAQLNIGKLGAICNTYLVDHYGEVRDGLNVGLPTDRFQVDWWLNSAHVEQRLAPDAPATQRLGHYLNDGAILFNPPVGQGPATPPSNWEAARGVDTVLLEIPADFLALKAVDMGLALAWKLQSRALLVDLFADGFVVTDFVRERQPPPRSFYVLRRSNHDH